MTAKDNPKDQPETICASCWNVQCDHSRTGCPNYMRPQVIFGLMGEIGATPNQPETPGLDIDRLARMWVLLPTEIEQLKQLILDREAKAFERGLDCVGYSAEEVADRERKAKLEVLEGLKKDFMISSSIADHTVGMNLIDLKIKEVTYEWR
jgi:hypothetical protein